MKHIGILFAIIFMIGCFMPISSGIYSPSLPFIANGLNTSINSAQWSVAIFMLGIALSQLFYGPLSEALGRKLPLLIGLFIAIIGLLICVMSQTITVLIIGRFIQGIGAGAGAALWRSVFRDSFSGKELAKLSAYFAIIVGIIVPIAPVLGGYLEEFFGWRAAFIFLLAYAFLAILLIGKFYNESHSTKHKSHLNLSIILKNYKTLFKSRTFMGYTLCVFLCYAAYFSWFVLGPILIIKHLEMSPRSFGWMTLFGGGVSMMVAGLIYGQAVKYIKVTSLLIFGFTIILFSGVLMLVLFELRGLDFIAIILPISLFYFGAMFVWPSLFSGAFESFGHIAGYAGSLYSFMQIAGGAFISSVISYLPDNNQVPMGVFMIIASLLFFSIYFFVIKHAKN